MKTLRPLAPVLALLCLTLPRPVAATGMPEDDDCFDLASTPEDLPSFEKGVLGIIGETLTPRWRAAAYRILVSGPLPDAVDKVDGGPDALKDWLTARAAVTEAAAGFDNVVYGYEYGNCYADAFVVAKSTLAERVKRFGARSAEVREWLTAQDLVFANCDKPEGATIPPEKIAATVAPLVQQDRIYQVGAALFYSRRLPDARAAFERVAADKSSPWTSYGRLAAVRAMIRQATAGEKNDDALLAQAEARLKTILADKDAGALHASARRLVRFIAFRLRPAEQLPILGELLARTTDDFWSIQTDFAWLASRHDGDKTAALVDAAAGTSDLTDWTLSWNLPPADRASRALTRWRDPQKSKSSTAWLLMALSAIDPADGNANALLEAARKIKPGTPGYFTAAFHRARVLIGQKRGPAARSLLDEVLAQKSLPRETHNLVVELRYPLSRSIDDAVPSMTLLPCHNPPSLLPAAAALYFQYLPIDQTIEMANNNVLPPEVRVDLFLTALRRSILLDDTGTAQAIMHHLSVINPKSWGDMQKGLASWTAATTREDRLFAFVDFWLRHDGGLIIGDGNCTSSAPALAADAKNAPPTPTFLSADSRARAKKESAQIDKLIGSDLTIFRANQTVAYAKSHPTDPRVEEDLHLAVKQTKWFCGKDQAAATAASKQAWRLLHNQYPKGSWTAQTKYWYP